MIKTKPINNCTNHNGTISAFAYAKVITKSNLLKQFIPMLTKNTTRTIVIRPESVKPSIGKLLLTAIAITTISSCKSNSIEPEVEHLSKQQKIEQEVEQKLIATEGTPANFAVCPTSPYDTIAPIDSLNPPAKVNEPTMTVEGIEAFIKQHNITTIEGLTNRFPEHYRHSFSLVEHTRATGESNLEFPRIVVFGPDGRFLLNIGTKPDDPKYHMLDVAELHDDTGQWEFSVFDFSAAQPKLTRNDPSCIECHGDKNSRLVWGSNLLWTGVFGDNIAKGPQGEALDSRHANRMNEIMAGKGGSPRFDFLIWDNKKLHRGGKRKLANHILGVDLFLSNVLMGSATARGAYTRLTLNYPEQYQSLREELIYSYYLKRGNALVKDKQQHVLDSLSTQLGMDAFGMDSLLTALGMDPKEAFSLATLAEKEPPQTQWRIGRSDLYDMLMLQILDDLRRDTPEVDELLKNRMIPDAIFGCPDTAKSVADVIDYKMLHLFHLKGSAKYEVHKKFYPLDIEDIYGRVFLPSSHALMTYLRNNISDEIKGSPLRGQDSVSNPSG